MEIVEYARLADDKDDAPAAKLSLGPAAPADRTLRTAVCAWSRNCRFSPDATTFATAGDDKKLLLHDVRSGGSRVAVERNTSIRSTAVCPTGERCAVGCEAGLLGVYRLSGAAGQPLTEEWRWEHKTAEGEAVKLSALAYNHDGALLAVAVAFTDNVWVHDAHSGGQLAKWLRTGYFKQALKKY